MWVLLPLLLLFSAVSAQPTGDSGTFRTGYLVDPETFPIVSLLTASVSSETLPIFRQNGVPPATDTTGVRIEEKVIPSSSYSDYDVTIYIYSPEGNTALLPGYLNVHGGGYVMGNTSMDGVLAVRLVRELGIIVVVLEYRLAPEHPGMAAVEDCYTVFQWMHNHGREVNIDNTLLAYGGASAGGGLAASLGLLIRDRNETRPVFQLLLYPMLDDRTVLRSPGNTGEFIWTPASNEFGWTSHLGPSLPVGSDSVSYYLSPARAIDLSGLPPTYIATGELDLFRDENIDYARKLLQSSVKAEFHVYPGMCHGVETIYPSANLSIRFIKDYVEALRPFISTKPSTAPTPPPEDDEPTSSASLLSLSGSLLVVLLLSL